MQRGGRFPVPSEKKRRNGNPGKRPLPVPATALAPVDLAERLPEPLRPLEEVGRALWERTIRVSAAWISTDTDIELLQMTCELLDERQRRRDDVMGKLRAGEWCRDESGALRAIEDRIVKNLQNLGLTPTDRARLGVAEVMTQSTLDTLRERQAKRRTAV